MRYILMLVLLLAGCSARGPKPEPIGEGRYTIKAESPSQASNAAAITRRQAIKSARRFCAKKDRGMDWLAFENGSTVNTYTTTLTFTCR
jgi:hypothetical protein